ncbi:MAG TPA: cell division protein FtsN, partial [Idiomarina abyssalis]|nr:cell division protein FtsN [Idiomarina abyssalis]
LLPEKSAERWRYIEELESKEVEVDVPEREVGPPKLMQCGSFRQQADAERLRAQIAMA